MQRSLGRRIAVILATVGVIAANGMATLFSPTGKNVGQISDQFQNFFTPAGYVFSIWGLIYSAFLAFMVYQALPAQAENPRLQRIDGWYMLSCAFNAGWIFVWQREWFLASEVMMIGLLVTLIVMYVKLDDSRYKVPGKEGWLVHWPVSVYLGWITIATAANTTILLQSWGWTGFGLPASAWGAILLSVAFVIVLAVTFPRRDKAYILVLSWASLGIFVKYKDTMVVAVTACAIALITFALAMTLYRQNSTAPKAPVLDSSLAPT